MRTAPAAVVLALLAACVAQTDPPVGRGFTDTFDRATIGSDYNATGPGYAIESGELVVRGAKNHPLWLRRRLPRDVRVEFVAWSPGPEGDIKVELFGDGVSFATSDEYTSTGYVFVFGGWRNTISVLARMDEHGDDRKERRAPRVEPGRRYRFAIERRRGSISWSIDGAPFLSIDDAAPLAGAGHDHFGFNDWQAELHFDDLRVRPL